MVKTVYYNNILFFRGSDFFTKLSNSSKVEIEARAAQLREYQRMMAAESEEESFDEDENLYDEESFDEALEG